MRVTERQTKRERKREKDRDNMKEIRMQRVAKISKQKVVLLLLNNPRKCAENVQQTILGGLPPRIMAVTKIYPHVKPPGPNRKTASPFHLRRQH